MHIIREQDERGVYLRITSDPADIFTSHRVHCSHFDFDFERSVKVAPTVRISLLSLGGKPTPDEVMNFARELSFVAGAAAALEAEMRAAYETKEAHP